MKKRFSEVEERGGEKGGDETERKRERKKKGGGGGGVLYSYLGCLIRSTDQTLQM